MRTREEIQNDLCESYKSEDLYSQTSLIVELLLDLRDQNKVLIDQNKKLIDLQRLSLGKG